jgi:hypothetical protein
MQVLAVDFEAKHGRAYIEDMDTFDYMETFKLDDMQHLISLMELDDEVMLKVFPLGSALYKEPERTDKLVHYLANAIFTNPILIYTYKTLKHCDDYGKGASGLQCSKSLEDLRQEMKTAKDCTTKESLQTFINHEEKRPHLDASLGRMGVGVLRDWSLGRIGSDDFATIQAREDIPRHMASFYPNDDQDEDNNGLLHPLRAYYVRGQITCVKPVATPYVAKTPVNGPSIITLAPTKEWKTFASDLLVTSTKTQGYRAAQNHIRQHSAPKRTSASSKTAPKRTTASSKTAPAPKRTTASSEPAPAPISAPKRTTASSEPAPAPISAPKRASASSEPAPTSTAPSSSVLDELGDETDSSEN